MAIPNTISLIYYGGDADRNRLNLYDASHSYEGLARTLAILGHYYLTQEIIYKAPQSMMPLYLVPPESGSYKQQIIVGVVIAALGTPFVTFADRVIDYWIPSPDSIQRDKVIDLLIEQNNLLRQSLGLPKNQTQQEKEQVKVAEEFISKNEEDIAKLRKITSQSFKQIFRPIETGSAEHMGIIGGSSRPPKKVVDREVLALIEADTVDQSTFVVMGVVNSFNTVTKTGSIFSRDFDASIRIEYDFNGRLPRGDDFSWSQLNGKPIRMSGNFVRYFDGNVKKLLVRHVERVTDQLDVHDYFHHDRTPLSMSPKTPPFTR
jgi:hypothetical protein